MAAQPPPPGTPPPPGPHPPGAPPPPPEVPLGADPDAAASGSGRGVLIAVAAVAAVALLGLGVLLAVVVSGGRGEAEREAFRSEVAAVLSPVLTANQQLSGELSRLTPGSADGARAAAGQLQTVTATARSSLGALEVPDGEEQLVANAQRTLDHADAYLSAVNAVLADPGSATVAQLPTLAANLSSAFATLGSDLTGGVEVVSGVDALVAWAEDTQTAEAEAQEQEAEEARRLDEEREAFEDERERWEAERDERERAERDRIAASGNAPPAGLVGGQACSPGLWAGPNTSCPFAENVRDAWYRQTWMSGTVRVFSPVTGRSYNMYCSPGDVGIVCTGGNNASVIFQW